MKCLNCQQEEPKRGYPDPVLCDDCWAVCGSLRRRMEYEERWDKERDARFTRLREELAKKASETEDT